MPSIRAISIPFLFALCVSGVSEQSVAPRWNAYGPPAGQIQRFEYDPADPTIVYAAADNGIYRSADGGTSWALVRTTMGRFIFNVRVAPSNPLIVYGASTFGVYRSLDRGLTWTLTSGASWYAIAVSPTDANLLLAYTSYGFVRSEDGGQTFQTTGAGFPTGQSVQSLIVDPSLPTTLYASILNLGVYRSTDGGTTWSSATTGLRGTLYFTLAALSSPAGTLFIATNDGLYRTTDRASSWAQVPSRTSYIYSVDATGSTVASAAPLGVQISTDQGATWTSPKVPAANTVSLNPGNPADMLVVAQQGLYRSTDGATTFPRVGQGMTSGGLTFITASRRNEATLLAGGGFGLYRSANHGVSWTRLGMSDNYPVSFAELDPDDDSVIYVLTNNQVQKSVNGGTTFVNFMTGLPPGAVSELAVDPTTTPRTLYAGASGSVYRRSGDAPWTAAVSGLPSNFTVTFLTVDPKNPATVYAGDGSTVRRSKNSGVLWEEMNLPSNLQGSFHDLIVDPNDSQHLVLNFLPTSWETRNGGATWSNLDMLPPSSTLVFDPSMNGQIYARQTSRILRRAAGSSDWVDVFPTEGRVDTRIFAISADGKAFYTGGSLGGVWVYRIDYRRRAVGR